MLTLTTVPEEQTSEIVTMQSDVEARDTTCCPSDQEHRLDAIIALETAIVYLVTVVLQTLAIHYILANANGFQYHMMVQEDILRILGSMWVDITALYFIILGYRLHESVAEETQLPESSLIQDEIRYNRHMDVIRTIVPDLTLSCIPYVIMQPISRYSNTWTAIYTGLSPTLLSTLVDVRVNNEFRMLNESMWIAQLTAIYTLLAYVIQRHVKNVCDTLDVDYKWNILRFEFVAAWLLGFLHLYAAFEHPVVANAVTRSVFTNAVFVLAGMYIAAIPRHKSLQNRVQGTLQSLSNMSAYKNRWIQWGTVLFVLGFYLHHTQNTTENTPENKTCVNVFGGTPCLWYVDICNVRMYPVYTFFFLWFSDTGILFENDLFGPIQCPLTETFAHVSKWVAQWKEYNTTFVLYSEFVALLIASHIMYVCPALAINYSTITILAEIFIVTITCIMIKTHITPMTIRAFDSVLQYTGANGLIMKALRYTPL